MTGKTLFWIISLCLTLNSVVIAGLTYWVLRRADNRRGFLDQFALYRTDDVQAGIRKLWQLFRSSNSNLETFLDMYMRTIEEEEQKGVPIKRSLHYQRRKVSEFYCSLGSFLKYHLLPRRLVYYSWYQDDVEIVERLLIPVENKIARSLGVSELSRQSDPLYYVVSVKNKFQKMAK